MHRKLKKVDVIEIRKLILEGIPCAKIARIFGVTREAISHIKNGKSWKGVK